MKEAIVMVVEGKVGAGKLLVVWGSWQEKVAGIDQTQFQVTGKLESPQVNTVPKS